MPGDVLPSWAIKFLLWGSGCMGAALVSLLIWVSTVIREDISDVQRDGAVREKRIDRLEYTQDVQMRAINEALMDLKRRIP